MESSVVIVEASMEDRTEVLGAWLHGDSGSLCGNREEAINVSDESVHGSIGRSFYRSDGNLHFP